VPVDVECGYFLSELPRRLASEQDLEVLRVDLITNPLTAGHIELCYLPISTVHAIENATRSLLRALRSRLSSHTIMVPQPPGCAIA